MAAMSQVEYQAIINRQRRLPEQLHRARRRVQQLENEAARLGLRELLEDPTSLDRAWEREIEIAAIQGAAK